MEPLERYRSIVDDFPTFFEASKSPLPLSVWRNRLRVSSDELLSWFDDLALNPTDRPNPVPWSEGVYTLQNSESIRFVAAYLSGLLHIQEEIAMLPVVLLDPQSSDRVLDLCAAPGNKTACVAVRTGGGGTVVANDISRSRLGVVRSTVDRLGLANVILTALDATTYPEAAGMYDRVLVDVPCSCEGNSRKYRSVQSKTTKSFRERLIGRQKLILERALKLCKPGGRVVYSTCTYAPEECEGVVASVLEETEIGRSYSILPLEVVNLTSSEGLTRWNGVRYPSEMTRAFRIWPHQNDTGGFFAVALSRNGKGSRFPIDPVVSTSMADVASVIPEELDHFQIPPESLDDYRVNRVSNKYDSIEAKSVLAPPPDMCFSRGVRAINRKGKPFRLSTAGVLLLGHLAQANRVPLTSSELDAFFSRKPLEIGPDRTGFEGAVFASHQRKMLGRGVIQRNDRFTTVLESQFPRVWAGVQVESKLRNLLDPNVAPTPYR